MAPLPLFNGKYQTLRSNSHQLSSKEKRYQSAVEKSLQTFESVDEWADYISFLAKLQKALQSNPDPETTNWIPCDFEVSKTLSKCISPNLPSGVHRKTIELYSVIFSILQPDNLSKSVNLWLPGLLPLMSFASMNVKSELMDLYNNYLCKIDSKTLRICFKPILLSLLPALDDTTSEFFNPALELIDSFKKQLDDDDHFWQCLFLSIITSPDKRSGAMEFCNKRLPDFSILEKNDIDITIEDQKLKKETLLSLLPKESKSCLTPESGLLVRAFSESLKDENLFVQRGFFDLLLSRLPLNSLVCQFLLNDQDKECLILNAATTVLRKDMSLNRRLWNWLLGPENLEILNTSSTRVNASNSSNSLSTINKNTNITSRISRVEYFKKFSHKHFLNALISLIDGVANERPICEQRIDACKISIAIMDKWEIGQSIVPKILISILKCAEDTFENGSTKDFENIVKTANDFFDGVETHVIWSDIFKLIENKEIGLVSFVLKNFNVEDEDMIIIHIPLILLSLLSSFKIEGERLESINLIKSLVGLIPQRALQPIDHAHSQYSLSSKYVNTDQLCKDIMSKLSEFYSLNEDDAQSQMNSTKVISSEDRPYLSADLSALYLGIMTNICTNSLKIGNSTVFYHSCDLLNSLLQIIPSCEKNWDNSIIKTAIIEFSYADFDDKNVSIAFGISLIFQNITENTPKLEVLNILKILMNLFWKCLIHPNGKYQVETVRKIWDLEMIVGSHFVEAALCQLFIESDYSTRIRAFNILWIHSNSENESDSILVRPLYLILDDLDTEDEAFSLLVTKWIKSTVNSGTLNRIFKICCNELFKNKFVGNTRFNNNEEDDFGLFAYQLKTIQNLLTVETESLIPIFNSELCVVDNDRTMQMIQSNNWNISTYKSLLIIIIFNFLSSEPPKNLTAEDFRIYSSCVKLTLSTFELLIDGSESNFDEFPTILTQICQTYNISKDKDRILISCYLSTLSKLMKISSQKQLHITLFDLPKTPNTPINFLEFVQKGISASNSPVELNSWINLILNTSSYYSELIFRMTIGLTDCICDKIMELFSFNTEHGKREEECSNLQPIEVDESICELINGLQNILHNSHKYFGYISSGSNFGYGNFKGTSTAASSTKESGFFGSVIQGVFQIESPNEKDEINRRKVVISQALKKSVITVYQIWLWSEKNSTFKSDLLSASMNRDSSLTKSSLKKQNSDQDNKPPFLSFSKSVKYNATKLKFRSKKLLENIFSVEPLETLEALIGCHKFQKSVGDNDALYSTFKIIHVLDDSRSQTALPYIINALISRVNFSSLDESKRSLMLTELTDRDISKFLVDYVQTLSSDLIEDIWPQISQFLKDGFSNPTYYKLIYPDILKFTVLIGMKISQTSFGEQKKIKREMVESFTKILNLSVTVKVGPYTSADESSLTSILNPMNMLPNSETNTTLNKNVEAASVKDLSIGLNAPSEKGIFREELCQALTFSIPHINTIVSDPDKLQNCFISIVNGVASSIGKRRGMDNIPYYVLGLFKSLGNNETCKNLKVWKSLCNDILIDSDFFKLNINGPLNDWNEVLGKWISGDIGKLDDFIVKLSTYTANNSTLFNWSDSEASTGGILTLKRIAYLILVCPNDTFINSLPDLQNKIHELFKHLSAESNMKSYLFLLLRVLITKFSETHLVNLWTLVYTELEIVFQEVLGKLTDLKYEDDALGVDTKSIDIGQINNQLILQACKFLDVLLVLELEEFQLSEWLFINNTLDAIFGNGTDDTFMVGLIDKISSLKNLKIVEVKSAIKNSSTNLHIDRKEPLLFSVQHINQIFELRQFFDRLAIYKYENDYSMKPADKQMIEKDIYNDLFYED